MECGTSKPATPGRVVVIIPTYNERENIVSLIEEILSLPAGINVLVVDDDSPDGTGRLAAEHFKENCAVDVCIRHEQRGRGRAGIFGYRRALGRGFDIIGEMDGDGSHGPRFIPAALAALAKADVAVGSRYLPGGGEQRPGNRRFVTLWARRYLAVMLGIRLTDPTSGFRFFRRGPLAAIVPRLVATDPFIVTEVNYHLCRCGFSVVEIPIFFADRKAGVSKLKFTTLLQYLFRVLFLRIRHDG